MASSIGRDMTIAQKHKLFVLKTMPVLGGDYIFLMELQKKQCNWHRRNSLSSIKKSWCLWDGGAIVTNDEPLLIKRWLLIRPSKNYHDIKGVTVGWIPYRQLFWKLN